MALTPALPRALLLRLAFVAALGVLGSGCRTQADSKNEEAKEVVDSKPINDQLPPIELRDDTTNLLLTWLDKEGEFHVVEKPSDVPPEGRSQVRVVITTKTDGTGQLVYVANLTQPGPDGKYPVATMTRAQWDSLGAGRRNVRLEDLRDRLKKEQAAPAGTEPIAAGSTRAVVYGADWCKPCHEAESYLKSLGVDVEKKDIEKSNAARAEMEQKLSKAGKAGASIPVIDVMGQLFVGFNKGVLRRAVERSSANAKPL